LTRSAALTGGARKLLMSVLGTKGSLFCIGLVWRQAMQQTRYFGEQSLKN
jgi:hypothetical protein